MKETISPEELKRNLLVQAQEDHLGLWWVIEEVARHLHSRNTDVRVRVLTLSVIGELLGAGLWQAGFPEPNGSDFQAWVGTPGEILSRIEAKWSQSRQPTIGEVAWFTTTPAGDRAASELRSGGKLP